MCERRTYKSIGSEDIPGSPSPAAQAFLQPTMAPLGSVGPAIAAGPCLPPPNVRLVYEPSRAYPRVRTEYDARACV